MITFAMIKPHAVKNSFAFSQIMKIIDENKFRIVKKSRISFNVNSAEKFYEEHKGKFYFNRLVTFMSRYVKGFIKFNLFRLISFRFQWAY